MDEQKQIAKIDKRPLPKIDDLYSDIELASKMNDLSRLLNHPPKKEWLKKHPFAKKEVVMSNGEKTKVPIDYLPIGIVEYISASIFIKSRTEIKSVQVIANSIVLTVRVWVLDPVTGDWDWQEGIGAAPIRTNKGAAATDFSQVQDSAVQTGAPAAKTFAEKDAYEKFGKIFGRDLNRAEDMLLNYESLGAKFADILPIPDELRAVIEETELEAIQTLWRANPQYHGNPEFLNLLNARKEALKTTV